MWRDAWRGKLGRLFSGASRTPDAPTAVRDERPPTPTWPEFDDLVRRLGWAGSVGVPSLPAAEWPPLLARVKALRHRVLAETAAGDLSPEQVRGLQEDLLLGWQVVFHVWALEEGLFERHDPIAAARRRDELRQAYLDRAAPRERAS